MLMTIRRIIAVLSLASGSIWAQSGELGSMRDPRAANQQTTQSGAIQPWLAVTGNYETYIDQPVSTLGSVYRSLTLSGGLSMAKAYQRTNVVLGYAGSGSDYLGRSAGIREGWSSSNVANLAVSSQVARRLTLDFTESGGAANGGFGSASAGLGAGGLGMLPSLGVSSGFLFGGGAGLGGSSGLNPLQNNLVDADYYQKMTYFSSTSVGVGILLSNRTMLNIGGSASFIRRDGRSFSDTDGVGANATLSTRFSHRFSAFVGYSFNRYKFINSIGSTSVQGGFTGFHYALSPHDEFSLSVSDGYLDSKFARTVALPPDIALLLGVSTTTTVRSNSRSYLGGSLGYNHAFQRGGFDLTCSSSIAPGNDLILMARTHGCTISLSRTLSERLSITGIGGMRRLSGLAQAGSRYDVLDGGLLFSYRIFSGVSLTAGAEYRTTQIHPSTRSTSDVSANGGLRWSPRDGVRLF